MYIGRFTSNVTLHLKRSNPLRTDLAVSVSRFGAFSSLWRLQLVCVYTRDVSATYSYIVLMALPQKMPPINACCCFSKLQIYKDTSRRVQYDRFFRLANVSIFQMKSSRENIFILFLTH